MRLDIHGVTHAGRVRAENEDHFLVARLDRALHVTATNLETARDLALGERSAWLLGVADGVAGKAGGKAASSAALTVFARRLAATAGGLGDDPEGEMELLDRLEAAVDRAQDEVLASGGATTLTLLLVDWPRAYVVHIGDSRFYYLRRSRLRLFTRDQNLGNLLTDDGLMPEDEARRSRLSSALGSALGSEIRPSFGVQDFEEGDVGLVCTDGLTRHLEDAEIAEHLGRERSAEEIADGLLAETLERGAQDNVTLVVLRPVTRSAGA